MMNKEGSTKIVNFMTPGAGVVVVQGRGHIKLYSENAFFFSTPKHRTDKVSI